MSHIKGRKEDFMSELRYEPKSKAPLKLESDFYPVFSLFSDRELNAKFMQLKANICDLNPALVTKCITGTEQDFIMLMDRAKDFIRERLRGISDERKLLEMFRQCVFGYYVLTPLVEAKEVSDIKVLDYDHIVVKANGRRYVAKCQFFDQTDYKDWFSRILHIHRLGKSE